MGKSPSEAQPAAADADIQPEARAGYRAALIAVIVFAVLAAWNGSRRDFWGSEVTVAQVGHEISESGAWLIPTLGGEPYLVRPPLVFWLTAAASWIPGDPHFVLRLPTVLFAAAGLVVSWFLARRLFDDTIALLALGIHASTLLVFAEAGWLGGASVGVTLLELAIGSFLIACEAIRPARWVLTGWLALAAASLAVSPLLAIGSALVVVGGFLLVGGKIRRLRQGLRLLFERRAVIAYLAIVAPWYVNAWIAHPEAMQAQFVKTGHLGLLIGDGSASWSIHPYLIALVLGLLPWTLFVPLGFFHGKDRLKRPGQRAAMAWSVGVFVVLQFPTVKPAGWLLLIWPPLTWLIASGFLEQKERFSLWEDYLREFVVRTMPTLCKIPLIVTGLAAAAFYTGLHEKIESPELRTFLDNSDGVRTLLGIAAVAGAIAWVTGQRVRARTAGEQTDYSGLSLELSRSALLLLFATSFFFPVFNATQSGRAFIESVAEKTQDGALATYGQNRLTDALYYLPDRKIDHFARLNPRPASSSDERPADLAAIEEFLGQEKPTFLLMSEAERRGLVELFPGVHSKLEPVLEGRIGMRGEFLLLQRKTATDETGDAN